MLEKNVWIISTLGRIYFDVDAYSGEIYNLLKSLGIEANLNTTEDCITNKKLLENFRAYNFGTGPEKKTLDSVVIVGTGNQQPLYNRFKKILRKIPPNSQIILELPPKIEAVHKDEIISQFSKLHEE